MVGHLQSNLMVTVPRSREPATLGSTATPCSSNSIRWAVCMFSSNGTSLWEHFKHPGIKYKRGASTGGGSTKGGSAEHSSPLKNSSLGHLGSTKGGSAEHSSSLKNSSLGHPSSSLPEYPDVSDVVLVARGSSSSLDDPLYSLTSSVVSVLGLSSCVSSIVAQVPWPRLCHA